MRVIDLGQTGEPFSATKECWDSLNLPCRWRSVIDAVAPGSIPHDVQVKTLRDCKLLQSRRNLVISGPTNSGKSLLCYLAVLSGLMQRRRALLIEPFKALAQEKYDELTTLLPLLAKILGANPNVEITTGDYRLKGETLMAAPPEAGEIVIATPERVDAVMRNPDFDSWVSSFGVVCVDEAHLIGEERRGPTLEGVITRFLCEKAPPRFVLLSATIGGCEALKEWLQPCDFAISTIRRPPLQQEVIALEEGEKADDALVKTLSASLSENGNSALVFVYRTADAARLADQLSDKLGPQFGEKLSAAYHSKMPADKKAEVRAAYEKGELRCLVSTTALGAGVNLPATHVIVRDLTFGIEGPLPLRDLLQMMGRAGRGDRCGKASAILKPKDAWEEAKLVEQIKNPAMPELRSALLRDGVAWERRPVVRMAPESQAAKLILGELVRREKQTIADLSAYFSRSLGGKEIGNLVPGAIRWLCDAGKLLAWQDESGVGATALGKAVARTGIPLEVGAGFATLVRDVLECDPEDKLLGSWKPLDSLLVLELLDPREGGLKRFGKDLPVKVDDWIEHASMKSALFAEWIRGTVEASKADQVLGSLSVRIDSKRRPREATWQYAYLATMRAIAIYQLGSGQRVDDVARRWGITGLDGVEERWRDHLLWQLAGIAELLDIKCFYYCLKQDCGADDTRVSRVKRSFKAMLVGVYDLMGMLRFCSPLGPIFRDLEAAKAGVGIRTKEKLEGAGIVSFSEINKMSTDELVRIGIMKNIAKKLISYIKKRSL